MSPKQSESSPPPSMLTPTKAVELPSDVIGRHSKQNMNTQYPVRFRGWGFAPRQVPAITLLTFIGVILVWQWLASASSGPLGLPSLAEVVAAFYELFVTGDLVKHLGASLQRLLWGWLLGASLGMAVGCAIGMFTLARSTALPLVLAIFPIPKVALLPLFILWFGIGESSKIATIAFGVFSPMVVATFGGIDGVDRSLIRMAQSFEVPTLTIVRKIILPGAMGSILSGVQISASIGILLLVAAEMIAAQHGIGALVIRAGNLMRTDELMVGVFLLSAIGLGVSQLIAFLKRYLLHWR